MFDTASGCGIEVISWVVYSGGSDKSGRDSMVKPHDVAIDKSSVPALNSEGIPS
jgi:hypothetical protein